MIFNCEYGKNIFSKKFAPNYAELLIFTVMGVPTL